MRHNRRVYIAFLSLLGIFIFMSLILYNSLNWFQNEWGGIDFTTAVFQLSTPLKGTNSDVIYSYIAQCIPSAVLCAVCVVTGSDICRTLCKKIRVGIFIKLFSLRKIARWFSGKLLIWLWGGGIAVLTFLCWVKLVTGASEIGVFKYIQSIRNKSRIYEEYYVTPSEEILFFPEQKRNLLLIYLESMESTYASIGEGGAEPINYIPELTTLAKENISFSNTDKLGGGYCPVKTGWTMAAMLATSSGVPFNMPIGGNSMNEYEKFLPGLITLGDILEQEGYTNYFLCGSDAEFGGRELFYRQHGNYTIQDYGYAKENGYIPKDYKVFWGYEDSKLFAIAQVELGIAAKSGAPFNYTMITVDTHHPAGYVCALCDRKYEEQYANVIACSDRQVTEFVRWVQEQEWYEDTTVILVGDHISMVADFFDDVEQYPRRTYNCFLNLPENLKKDNTTDRKFTTLDLFPTVLASLGVEIEGNRLGLGTNLFSERETLWESLGSDYLNELSKYSDYFVEHFEK